MEEIIVGIDFSRGSECAIELGIDIANRMKHDIKLVYITPETTDNAEEGTPGQTPPDGTELPESTEQTAELSTPEEIPGSGLTVDDMDGDSREWGTEVHFPL
jgi:nucleotide-binding universal stress UspA family protein